MIATEIRNPVPDQKSKAWLLPYIITLLAMLTMQMATMGYAPLTPQIVQEFKLSYTQLGLFAGAYGLMSILLSVPAGMAVHRFSEKRVLFLGLVVTCIGIALLSRAIGFITAFGSLIVWYAGFRFAFVGILRPSPSPARRPGAAARSASSAPCRRLASSSERPSAAMSERPLAGDRR